MLMQCISLFSVQEDAALAVRLKSTRRHFNAKYAEKCFLWQNFLSVRMSSGAIVFSDRLVAMIVCQHVSARCAR
eukprot:8269603-Karenia_brevis.AAC.1